MSNDSTNNPIPGLATAANEMIRMPARTVWPMVLALGMALLAIGIITNIVFTAVGGVLVIVALCGWMGQLFPGSGEVGEELAPLGARASPVRESAPTGARAEQRPELPERIHPYSAGVKGGIWGGIVMAVLALIYGATSGHGIWYPVNLLAGTVLPAFKPSVAESEQFSWLGLFLGLFLHVVGSISNGILAGALLPMLPGWPIFWAGVVAPCLWSGAVWGFMGVINPVLEQHVDWAWFVGSQFAYGLALGWVVQHSEKVPVRPREGRAPAATEGQA